MRLKESLNFNDLFSKLGKECSEICKAYKETGKYLYRGSDNSYGDFEKVIPRTDRKPRDTADDLHEVLDDEFKELFGWRARSEGVFASSNAYDVQTYGRYTYIIFPKDGFYYLWSKSVSDLPYTVGLGSYSLSPDMKYKYSKEKIKKWEDDRDKLIKKTVLSYKSNDLNGAIKSENEIMIKCDYYYVVHQERIEDIDEVL